MSSLLNKIQRMKDTMVSHTGREPTEVHYGTDVGDALAKELELGGYGRLTTALGLKVVEHADAEPETMWLK